MASSQNKIAEAFHRAIIGHPRIVLLVMFMLSVLSLTKIVDFSTGKPILELDPSVDSMLPTDDPGREYFEYMKTLFDGGETILVALVDEESVFTTDNLERIQRISEEIEGLPQVNRVSSLSMALNIRSEDGALLIEPFYDFAPQTPQELANLEQRALTDPIYAGNLVSEDGRVTVVMVHLLDIPEKDLLASKIDARIGEVAHAGWEGEIWVTGSAHIKAEMTNVMLTDLATVVPLAMFVMAAIAGLSFRTVRGVVIPVLTVGISVLITMGFISITYGMLNQVTVAVPSLLVVVGFAYAIHVLSNYYDAIRLELVRDGDTPASHALREITTPVVYTGITTAAGFMSLATSPLSAIQQFGFGAGVGVFVTMVVSLTFAPALLQLLLVPKNPGRKPDEDNWLDHFFERLADFDIKHSKTVLVIGGIVSLLSILALPHINISTDMVNSFKKSSEVRQDFYAVNENLQGANSFYVVLETSVYQGFQEPQNLYVIEDLQAWLHEQPEVGGTTSMVDYLKVINRGLEEGDGGFEIPADKWLVGELILLGGNDELKDFVDFDYQVARVVVRTTAMDSSEVSAFGERIEQYLAENVPPHLETQITGNSYLVAKTMDEIAYGQAVSIATAFIIIYLILVILFTSFKAGLIALIPNAVPVLLYFGILGWTGIDLNVTTGLVACIVLGIAVDDTIHLMAHFNRTAKQKANEAEGVLHALKTVGRPVTYTTAALCLGFLCMLMSDMRTQMEFGVLAALTLLGAWVVDVTFTPAIAGRMKIVSLWDVLTLNLGESPHKSIPLFHGLTPTQARIAALLAHIEEYRGGEQIFQIGDRGNHLYVVIEGQISVSLSREDGTVFLEKMGRGNIIGEVALYHGERTANVFANTDVRLLEITRDDLESIQKRHPKIAAQLYANLNEVFAGRMANLTSRIQA